MINSLSKDSHITRRICYSYSSQSDKSKSRNTSSSTPVYNSNIISNKPAAISFRGLASRTLANDKDFQKLVEAAKHLLGSDKKHSDVVKFIKGVADSFIPPIVKAGEKSKPKTPLSGIALDFKNKNKDLFEEIVNKTRELIKKDNLIKIPDQMNPDEEIIKVVIDPKDPTKKIHEYRLDYNEREIELLNSIGKAAEAVPAVKVKDSFYKKGWLKEVLLSAEKNNVAFSAGFALLLTCLLRPAIIMLLPGGNKHKDDKKYAASHSIASGIIGYILSTAVSTPFAKAVKKILANPTMYINKVHIDNDKAKITIGQYFERSKKASDIIDTWLIRSVDVAMAVPKGIITIALIPPILKYIFGWEKKTHKENKEQPIVQDYSNMNFTKNNNPRDKKFQHFVGVTK